MKGRLYLFFAVVVVIFLAFLPGFALLHSGLPPTHDGEYHIIRFYEFDKVLRSGSLYPRWAPDLNNGYGVPLFNYVYPLPNYIASFLHVFGVSFIDAFKLNMFIALLCGAVFFYLWSKMFWGNLGAIASSVFYTYAPYHFLDIYVRGSVGEVWALAFFPAFLWCITKCIKEKKSHFSILAGFFLAAIIFSHNILALMFFPFALSYIAILFYREENKKYLILNTLYIILLGLGLSAIFWFPAILEKQYVTGLQIYDVEKNFPELYQLLIPSWGSGFSEGDLGNQMSFQIGIANLFAVLLSIFTSIFLYKKKDKNFAILFFFLCWFFLVLFLLLKTSLVVWQNVPFMNYFQFPWRFLSLEILVCAFLAGSVASLFKSRIIILIIIFLPLIFGIEYAKPAFYHNRDDAYYFTRSNFIDGTNSPGDLFNTIWFNRDLKKQKEKIILEKGVVLSTYIKPTKYTFDVRIDFDTKITVNTAYFPGWTAIVNKKEIGTKPDNNGLITFSLPKGNNSIEIKLQNSLIRIIGVSISYFSFLAMIISVLWHGIIKK